MAKGINYCTFVGRATRDAETKVSNSGITVCKFGMAVNGYKENDVSFFDFVIFGKFADAVGRYITKGKQLAIGAEAKQNTWNDRDTGKSRSKIEFIVKDLMLLGGGSETKQTEEMFKTNKSDDFDEDLAF